MELNNGKIEQLQNRIYELEKQQRTSEASLNKDKEALQRQIGLMELKEKETNIR